MNVIQAVFIYAHMLKKIFLVGRKKIIAMFSLSTENIDYDNENHFASNLQLSETASVSSILLCFFK